MYKRQVLTDGDAAMLQSAAFLRAQLVYISYYALEADLPDGSQSLADYLMDLGVFTRDEWRGSWKLVIQNKAASWSLPTRAKYRIRRYILL